MNKLLFLDTETGGLDENENSLLSVGLVVWEDGKITNQKELFIKKDKYNVTKEALEVNKIDLEDLKLIGISEKDCINQINDFVNRNFSNKAILSGHNISFDIAFVKNMYRRNNMDFGRYFSHRSIDTSTLLRTLYYADILKSDISSSDKAFSHYNIKFEDNKRHSALGDAVATAMLYNKIIEEIKGN